MKILWTSNAPWSSSGYGQQSALFLPRIAGLGHDVALSCFYGLEGGCLEWNGMHCYPTDHSRFGNLMLGEYAAHHGEGDRESVLVMTLQDVWVLLPGLPNFKDLRFASWCPVDHDPCPPLVTRFLKETRAQTVAMTRFGQKALEGVGIPSHYVPHGYDGSVFRPIPEQRTALRQALKIPEDAFVVGVVANNQGIPSRKSFPQIFAAFKEFQAKHSDAILYIHADVFGRNNGINLIEMGKAMQVPAASLRTSDQMGIHLGVPPEQMAGIYNTFNVLCMPSMGEGFGIPLIEAQACGVPVITTDWTAMTELCGAGWLVDGERFYDPTQGSFQKLPYVPAIVDALEQAYEDAEWLGEAAAAFAQPYEVNTVMQEHWVPTMEALTKPREIAPLVRKKSKKSKHAKKKAGAR